jgi:hypothetical protein
MMSHNVFKREASVHKNEYKATTDMKDFRSRSRIQFEHARNNSLQSFLNYFQEGLIADFVNPANFQGQAIQGSQRDNLDFSNITVPTEFQ